MGILVKEEHNGGKDVERGWRIDENARPHLRLFSITRSIAVAAELGIADRLADGVLTTIEDRQR